MDDKQNDLLDHLIKQTEDMGFYSQFEKMGNYDNPEDGCPNCGRYRVMLGKDNKHRCEKCQWCIEDSDYDYEFMDYMK